MRPSVLVDVGTPIGELGVDLEDRGTLTVSGLASRSRRNGFGAGFRAQECAFTSMNSSVNVPRAPKFAATRARTFRQLVRAAEFAEVLRRKTRRTMRGRQGSGVLFPRCPARTSLVAHVTPKTSDDLRAADALRGSFGHSTLEVGRCA